MSLDILKKKKIDLLLGSVLMSILRIPVTFVGRILRRDHSSTAQGTIVCIKMLGGGSLVIAYPALMGIRRKYKASKIVLVTTRSIHPFAESIGVFDEILCVDDSSFARLAVTGILAWWKTFGKTDTLLDLEVYSRLTTVFSVLTLARNRIGFYLESTYWRKNIYTHLIFFNRFSGSYHFYEQMARIIGAEIEPRKKCEKQFRSYYLGTSPTVVCDRIAVGHSCSDFGKERMLSVEQWQTIFSFNCMSGKELIFLGSKADHSYAQEIIDATKIKFPYISFVNMCGELSLADSIKYIDSASEFWGIDSSLLHYARLLGKKNVSFWGPTDPETRLKNDSDLDSRIYYRKLFCSPCIHVAESPPCNGRNRCIAALFEELQGGYVVDRLSITEAVREKENA